MPAEKSVFSMCYKNPINMCKYDEKVLMKCEECVYNGKELCIRQETIFCQQGRCTGGDLCFNGRDYMKSCRVYIQK